MTTTKRLLVLLALVLTPACGDVSAPPVDWVDYAPDGALTAFMPTGIHIISPSLDRETRTVAFDGRPRPDEIGTTLYDFAPDAWVAAVSFLVPQGSGLQMPITLFDLATGTELQTFRPYEAAASGRAQAIVDLRLSPRADLVYSRSVDEDPLAIPSDAVWRSTVVDVATGTVLWTTDRSLHHPVFSADGARLFVVADDPRHLEMLDARTGVTLNTADFTGFPGGFSLTADGKLMGIADDCTGVVGNCPSSFMFWSPADLTSLGEQPLLPGTFTYAVSQNQEIGAALTCSRWSNLCGVGIINTGTPGEHDISVVGTDGTPVNLVKTEGVACSFAFSPDGERIAVLPCERSAPIQVFRIADGAVVASLGLKWDVP